MTGDPNPSRHTLYGGMVAGVDARDDFAWSDDRNLFQRTEPATDFNAGLTGALARLAQEFGGSPLASFPPLETPDDEIFIDARIQDNQPTFTTIQAFIRNRSAWPTRVLSGASFRYYFNLEPGVTPAQLQLQTFTSECGSNVLSGPTQFSGNTYFVTVNCPGTIAPTGESDHRREVQFRITAPNTPGSWDPTNDYSFQGLTGTLAHTQRIVLFDNGVRIWGQDPGPATPDFSVSAAPAAVTVVRGATATSTVNVTRTGGFTGAVALTASGLPAGVTAAFNPASVTVASSTLTFNASATATTGTSTVTVTGTSGTLTHTTSITLTVNPAATPDFALTASPAAVSAAQGATGTSTINVARTGGFTGAVALTASGLPAGVTAAFNPASVTGASSTLTFTVSATAATGTSTVTVTGTSGTLTHAATISLTVSPAGSGNGGLTVTTAMGGSPPYYFENRLTLANTSTITAATITVVVQRTTGITFNGMYNTVGSFQQANTGNSNAASITYTWTLSAGQTLAPGSGRLFVAQTNGTGTAHPSSGDTWTVTFTTGGQTFTQSGTF